MTISPTDPYVENFTTQPGFPSGHGNAKVALPPQIRRLLLMISQRLLSRSTPPASDAHLLVTDW